MKVTKVEMNEKLVLSYAERLSEEVMISAIAKHVKKQSRIIAEAIIDRIRIDCYVKRFPFKSGGTYATKVTRKLK